MSEQQQRSESASRVPEPCGTEGAALFVYALRTVTEAAACAAYEWIGRGERGKGDRAAVDAMLGELDGLPFSCRVVVGDGQGGGARALNPGATFGTPCAEGEESDGATFDLAVDPIEGTSYLVRGMTNAMAAVALAPRGAMYDPGPAFYMEKLVVPSAAKDRLSPDMDTGERLETLASALAKPVSEITVFVLEKPRHRELVEKIHRAGARVALYPAGDIAGAIMAAIPDSGIDALMGTGGAREGIISAAAVRALGGGFSARIDPQLATEKAAVVNAGIDTVRWLSIADLVGSEEVYFCATGITTGLLFEGVNRHKDSISTQSLMIAGPAGERQILTTYHRLAPSGAAPA